MSVSYGGSNITFEDGSIVSSGSQGFKNKIINGHMMIDQRNAGASVTNIAGSVYTVDRWQAAADIVSKFTIQQSSTAPAGFVNSLLLTSSSAYTVGTNENYIIRTKIEGYNIADLDWGLATAKTVTLSFWVRSSLTGTFGGALANNASGRTYPFTYTISSANTWEQKSITIAGDTSGTWLTTNGIGLEIRFSIGSGSGQSGTAGSWVSSNYYSATGAVSVVGTSGATFYITGVQLEKSTTASSFEFRSYGKELMLCQRYYYRLKQPAGSNSGVAAGVAYTTTNVYGQVNFPVEMRTNPTSLEQNGTAADYDTLTNGNLNVCTLVPTFENATPTTSLLIWRYSAGTVTVGSGAICRMRNSTSYLAWSAEL
jgi:hypothetical protein